MLSSVLNSDRAIAVNIEIMRSFVRIRRLLEEDKSLARKFERLQRKIAGLIESGENNTGAFTGPGVVAAKPGPPVKIAPDAGKPLSAARQAEIERTQAGENAATLKAAQEKAAQDKAAQEKAAQEKLAADKSAADRAEAAKAAAAKAAAENAAKAKVAAQTEKERAEHDHQ
jgi:hypothetical protein